jgi:hypothetical protein
MTGTSWPRACDRSTRPSAPTWPPSASRSSSTPGAPSTRPSPGCGDRRGPSSSVPRLRRRDPLHHLLHERDRVLERPLPPGELPLTRCRRRQYRPNRSRRYLAAGLSVGHGWVGRDHLRLSRARGHPSQRIAFKLDSPSLSDWPRILGDRARCGIRTASGRHRTSMQREAETAEIHASGLSTGCPPARWTSPPRRPRARRRIGHCEKRCLCAVGVSPQ